MLMKAFALLVFALLINGDTNEGLFTVDVSDDRGNRILFRMQKEQESWKILPQTLPNWVMDKENTFHDLIEEELRSM